MPDIGKRPLSAIYTDKATGARVTITEFYATVEVGHYRGCVIPTHLIPILLKVLPSIDNQIKEHNSDG